MESLIAVMERTARPSSSGDLGTVILCVLMAFILGQAIAWTYAYTHNGLSYTRSFTQSLVVLTLVVALVMMVIGNNIVTAFGLIGALAIIRFRNVLKDTRDTVFVFLVLVVGMAVGSGKFMTAIVGTAAAILLLIYLQQTGFGALARFDGHLSFLAPSSARGEHGPVAILERFCSGWKRVSLRQTGGGSNSEFVYEISLLDPENPRELLHALETSPGIEHVSLVLQDDLAEI